MVLFAVSLVSISISISMGEEESPRIMQPVSGNEYSLCYIVYVLIKESSSHPYVSERASQIK